MKNLIFLLNFFCSVIICESINILCLFGVPSRSHHFWNSNLINTLAVNNGHNVTVLSVDIDLKPPENVHYIHLETVYPYIFNGSMPKNNIVERSKQNCFQSIVSFYNFGRVGCEGSVNSYGFQQLLNYPNDFQFDLVIYDFTCGPCLLGFLHKFNYPPLVSVSAFNTPQFTSALVGGRESYAIVPHFSLTYNNEMFFFQRIKNTIVHIFDSLYRSYVHVPYIDELIRKKFDSNLPYMSELEEKTEIILVNSNPAFDSSEFLPQNVIQVGGLQIRKPKQLPDDLKSFLDNSTKVVLFSLGTNVKGDMLSKDKQTQFLEAFKNLKQYKFLWKFELKDLPNTIPENVLVKSWLPQNDILAHPNVKAFINHGGLLSTHEAIWHGVPIIGMPVYVDQHRNLHTAESLGIAKTLDFHNLNKEIIQKTISNVLENPNYREKMFLTSKQFRDQPETPLDRAIWWIEWILRNSNSKHLLSKTKEMSFFSINLLDIFLFTFLTILVLFYFIKFFVQIIFLQRKIFFLKIKKNN